MKNNLTRWIVGAAGAALLWQAAPLAVQAADPVNLLAYWNFDDNSNPDITADAVYGIRGALENGAVYSAPGEGRTGDPADLAMDFGVDSAEQLVRVNPAAWLNIASERDQMTITFWQNLREVASSSTYWIESPSSSGTSRGNQAHVPWGNGNIYFDTSGCCTVPTQRLNDAPPTDFLTYHHFAFVKDGTDKRVYIDGVLFMENTGADALKTDMTQLTIGAAFDKSNSIHGWVDDFAVFAGVLDETALGQLASGMAPDALPGIEIIPAVAPVITSQPQDVTTVAGSPATFTVEADPAAFPAPYYQWEKNGTPIDGATSATLTIDRAALADNGAQITCKVFNGGGEVTSDAATLTVTADTVPPTLDFVTGSISFTQVFATFSEPLDPTTAQNAANYALSGGVTVTGAALSAPAGTAGDNIVLLTTSQQTDGTRLTLTVNNVTDVAGNPVAADSSMEFGTFVFQTGAVFHEFWQGVPNNIQGLRDDPRFPDNPTWTGIEPAVEYPPNGGNEGGSNYGNRLSCWVIPPATGNYVFFVNSDDPSELWLSTDEDPANVWILAKEEGWSNPRQWTSDANKNSYDGIFSEWPGFIITLNAGQKYYLEVLHTEGGGGDNAAATMVSEDDFFAGLVQNGDAPTLTGDLVGTFLDPNGAEVNITEQPQDATVVQNTTATFSVTAEGKSAYGTTVTYQWQLNGTDIAGANGASYTTPILTLADDGNQYTVVCSVPTLDVTSDAATLTVNPDTTPPEVVSAGGIAGDNQVGVQFNEALDQTSAENPANYSVNGATVTAATLFGDRIVRLDLSGTTPANVSVTVNGVTDLAGNPVVNGTASSDAVAMSEQDVGTVGVDPLLAGDGWAFGPDSFYVAGGGSDIWNSADGFHYVWKEFTGPFDIQVRVVSLEGTHSWAKSGIMVRESLEAGSRHASVVTTRTAGQNLYVEQWRETTDDRSYSQPGSERFRPVHYPNAWIRLVREDVNSNEIKSYIDREPGHETPVWGDVYYTHTLAMDPEGLLPETINVGLAVTSHDNSDTVPLAEAIFTDFSVKPYQEIVDPQLAISKDGGNVVITWQAGTLVSSPTVDGPYAPVAGAASPYSVSPTEAAQFYQVQQ